MADEFSHLRDDSENRTFVHDSVAKARPDGTVRDKPTGMQDLEVASRVVIRRAPTAVSELRPRSDDVRR
jgi:hypothetical protein